MSASHSDQPNPLREAARNAMAWVTERRWRMFTVAAVVLFLAAMLLLVVGSVAVDLVAGLVAVLGAASGLVAIATYLADRSGAADSRDLWDHDTATPSRPEDVFQGFSGFRE